MSADASAATRTAIDRLGMVVGTDRVLDDPAGLDRYSHDCWPLQTKLNLLGRHEHRPDVVVFVRSTAEVVEVLRVARECGLPVVPWGLGSSVTGQALPTRGGVVVDLRQLRGPLCLDAANRLVTVGAGWNGGDLEQHLNLSGFTLGHSPQSLLQSSVGGWVATMATGQLSSKYGGIEDLVLEVEVVLADGSVIRAGAVPRASLGPDLKRLFIGSEGTLGVITEVTLRVAAQPECRIHEAFHLPDVHACLEACRSIVQQDLRPALLRAYDPVESRRVSGDRNFEGSLLFVGTYGLREVAAAEHNRDREIVASLGGTSSGAGLVEYWLERRYDFSAVEQQLALPGGFAETIEVAHSWSQVEGLYLALRERLLPLADEVDGHFSHAYPQGTSLYMILFGRVEDDEVAAERIERIWSEAMTVALKAGAVISHHHGPGLARSRWLPQALGSAFPLLRRVKSALDPDGTLNPGKLGLG